MNPFARAAPLLFSILSLELSAAVTDSRLFPFVVPGDDVSGGVTDLSFLNDRPADRLVTVSGGHFFAGGERIRFWGMNNDYDANYPTHAEAEMLAKRFAKLGLNLLRITHTDQQYAPRGLFDPAFKGEMRLDSERLERLDDFISELKKRGIYVELSIHVSHLRMMERKGTPPVGERRYGFGSGLPLWNERFVEAEKQYARALLGHVNPYTGKSYLEEPAVAFVEIINENGILGAWPREHLRTTWSAELVADLQAAWNAWLQRKYRTTGALRQAWAAGEAAEENVELLKNPKFDQGSEGWGLQCVAPSTGTLLASKDGYEGKPCAIATSDPKSDQTWHVNLYQNELAIEKERIYRLSFVAKAEEPVKLRVSVSGDSRSSGDAGLSMLPELTRAWKPFSQCFAGFDGQRQGRLMFRLAQTKNRFHFADLSLKRVQVEGLLPQERLEAGNVGLPLTPSDCLSRTAPVARDVVDFFFEIDDRYFTTVCNYLKHELGCKHPIKGTQANSDYSSFFTQAKCDFIDVHGYWQHPRNANEPKKWTLDSLPMVNAAGQAVVDLAFCRIKGKPFNVSEYGHPAPNTFCSEEIPTVSAFASFQNWDGVTLFTYALRTPFVSDRITSFFEHKSHPTKLVTMPFGALAFRRGDLAPAREEISVGILLDDLKGAVHKNVKRERLAADKGATWLDAFTHGVSLTLGEETAPAFQPARQAVAVSDTGEMTYDTTAKDAAILVVNAARAKAMIGFGVGKTFDLGELSLKPGPTLQNGFSVITASVVSGSGFRDKGATILLTATGYAENTEMGWNADKTSVGDRWGKGPVLCEGIPFEVVLKVKRAKAWALDPRGQRRVEITPVQVTGGVSFNVGPLYKTLWYEVIVE